MELPEKSWTFDNWQDEMSGSLINYANIEHTYSVIIERRTPSQLGSLVQKLRNWKVCCES